ncbi:MAG: TRAP transporter substrate-binding protein DctP [Treponema sp.]|nr:TRAP transporter substrate-binding protein DctP [Treponema sp.]
MRKSVIFSIFFIILFVFILNSAFAQRGTANADTINIRFASPLPRNSEWGRALDRLAADWQRVTNNQVRVVVNHDGREGSESDMLLKLNSNSIQVALFSSAGMTEICPAIMNLSVPFMIRNEAEFDLVLENLLPAIESRVRNEYVVLAWSKGGWVYLFSKEPVFTPDDLRRQKLATSHELRDMNTVFRSMGFQLVETDWNVIGQRLASNMVNSIYVIPALIAPMHLHRQLNHMLELPIAPIVGAIVMNRVTWNKLSPAHQQELLRATRRMGAEFDASMSRTETAAISTMGRDGLSVNRPSQAQSLQWQTELNNTLPSLMGSVFDRELYNRINDILIRHRGAR